MLGVYVYSMYTAYQLSMITSPIFIMLASVEGYVLLQGFMHI